MDVNRREFLQLFGMGGAGFILNPRIEIGRPATPKEEPLTLADFDFTPNYPVVDLGWVSDLQGRIDSGDEAIPPHFRLFEYIDCSLIASNYVGFVSGPYYCLTGQMDHGDKIVSLYFFKADIGLVSAQKDGTTYLEARLYPDTAKSIHQQFGFAEVRNP